jgi:hypothetical protein
VVGAGPGPGGLWRAFFTLANRRGIAIRHASRAVDLVQDADSRTVSGAIAEEGGTRAAFLARRGVILATGGFDAAPSLLRDYMGFACAYPIGSPYNTGDGLRLAQQAGAALWHTRNQTITGGVWPAIKVAEYPAAFFAAQNLKVGSYIEIAGDGRRFYAETGGWNRFHNKIRAHGGWVDQPIAQVLPVHMIFDERVRRGCRLTRPIYWNAEMTHRWSADNSVELAKGWIARAETLAALAATIGRDPTTLEAAVVRYYDGARRGQDEFGREPGRLSPIEGPPYYALELVPGLVGTTGGARRLPTGHVLDHDARAIPGL